MHPIDLHTHTTESDGTDTPSAIIDYAIEKGLKAIAITDHDTIDGLEEACKQAEGKDIEVISGVEFSTSREGLKFDIHILGYYFDQNNAAFNKQLEEIRNSRHLRNLQIIEKLNDIGFELTHDEIAELAFDGVITRAHMAKAMVKKGYIKHPNKAFEKYIGNNCVAFVPRKKLTPEMAIEMILDAGGVPVIAHPTLYKLKVRKLDELVEELAKAGLKGIEGLYSMYDPHEVRYLDEMAKKHHLIITGGSDYHGENKPYIDLCVGRGKLYIDDSLLGPLREASEYYQSIH